MPIGKLFTKKQESSVEQDVTNLHSIATSATFVAGWTSAIIDNSNAKYDDLILSAKFALGNAAAVGAIKLWAFAMFDDANWPSLFSAGVEGVEGVATVKDITTRDAAMVLAFNAVTQADPGTDDVYYMPQTSLRELFGGFLPNKVVLFASHSTAVNLAATGSAVVTRGIYETFR